MRINLDAPGRNAAQRLMVPLWRAALYYANRDYKAGNAYRGTPAKKHKITNRAERKAKLRDYALKRQLIEFAHASLAA